ncbi:hypothetical protein NDU88_002272 [Pleurodeles waltl]|uniref:Uncharacterized protein n=1 Tax=Pleurodeles waltl TaxID=8319 RepID=A0AAV7MNW5_PLEWA|nr:hypothetical protein NDU88_002272 [Pleurodeles waltl]
MNTGQEFSVLIISGYLFEKRQSKKRNLVAPSIKGTQARSAPPCPRLLGVTLESTADRRQRPLAAAGLYSQGVTPAQKERATLHGSSLSWELGAERVTALPPTGGKSQQRPKQRGPVTSVYIRLTSHAAAPWSTNLAVCATNTNGAARLQCTYQDTCHFTTSGTAATRQSPS